MNVRAALGSELGRNGRRRNGVSRAAATNDQQSEQWSIFHGQDINPPPTSGLELMHTPSYKVLDFFRRNFCPLPRIGPFGFRRGRVDGRGRLDLLLCRSGVLAPKDAREEGHVGNATDKLTFACQKTDCGGYSGSAFFLLLVFFFVPLFLLLLSRLVEVSNKQQCRQPTR